MSRAGLGLAACCLVIAEAWMAAAPQRMPPRNSRPDTAAIDAGINEALAAYEAGDDLVVESWLRTAQGIASLPSVERVVGTGPWSRARAAFLLEVAVAPVNLRTERLMVFSQTFRTPGLLRAGRTLLASRPAPFGTSPEDDRFEVLWHQAAIGVAQGIQQYSLQQSYLAAIAPRFDDARQRGTTFETRIPLARAIAAAGLCCGMGMPGDTIQVRIFPSPQQPSVTADTAVALFTRAAEVRELRTEALIRGAILLSRIGREPEALAWFEQVPPHDDRGLGYMHHATLGRLLDGVKRPADAASAYAAALRFAPENQRAAIGLAAALLRSGRTEEAGRAADTARRLPEDRTDPVQVYARADARFVPGWLAEIRRLRR